jgi:hypothetical protein
MIHLFYYKLEAQEDAETRTTYLRGQIEQQAAQLEARLQSAWGARFCSSFEVICQKFRKLEHNASSDGNDGLGAPIGAPGETFYLVSELPQHRNQQRRHSVTTLRPIGGAHPEETKLKRNYMILPMPGATSGDNFAGSGSGLELIECNENLPIFLETFHRFLPANRSAVQLSTKAFYQLRTARKASVLEYRIQIEEYVGYSEIPGRDKPAFRAGQRCHGQPENTDLPVNNRDDFFSGGPLNVMARMALKYDKLSDNGRASALFLEVELPSLSLMTLKTKAGVDDPGHSYGSMDSIDPRYSSFLQALVDSLLPFRAIRIQPLMKSNVTDRALPRFLQDLSPTSRASEPLTDGSVFRRRAAMYWQMLFS